MAKTSKRAAAKRAPVRKRVSRKIRIVIADDQPIDRRGMASLLTSVPDFEVIAECSEAHETARRCQELKPSVVVLALRLATTGGGSALSALRAGSPETPILALAERGEGHCMVLNPPRPGFKPPRDNGMECGYGTDCLQLAVAEGATGTLRRSADPDELIQAVRTVAAGKAWYEAGTAASIMRHALARKEHQPVPLSERELEVAGLIAEGRSNKEISTALRISEPTVKKHVGHILAKLNLQDRLQIGLYVARHPLVLRKSAPSAAGG